MSWDKVELVNVNCQKSIAKPGGGMILPKPSFVYLGALVAADGDISSELARRLGIAQVEFSKLEQVWRQSGLTVRDKC